MVKLTRRMLLTQLAAGAAAVGGLAAWPGRAGRWPATSQPEGAAAPALNPSQSVPMVAYVRDTAAGELALMVGAREVVVRDRSLVARLLEAAG